MLIRELTLRGILSFGPDTEPLEMRSLNVVIGPNGSGKSNLLEAISLLRSLPVDLTACMRGAGGGITEWFWKGAKERRALVEAVVDIPGNKTPIHHRIEIGESSSQCKLLDERISVRQPSSNGDQWEHFYQIVNRRPVLIYQGGTTQRLSYDELAADQSVLAQWKDPVKLPQLAHLSNAYNAIRLYREWTFGRSSVFRAPQPADMPGDRLAQDFSNLGLFLNHLRGKPNAKKSIVRRLRDLYEGLDDFDVRVQGGTVEVFLTEGDFILPASRLSDGTLRYLCLLAILCDPDPPPLICIEEPELGLHPDMLPKIADLLIAASERTQLVVTTHSDILVDAMTERPESVVVMEKHDGKTLTRRLQNDDELKGYLENYRLGEMWLRGMIGGTRW